MIKKETVLVQSNHFENRHTDCASEKSNKNTHDAAAQECSDGTKQMDDSVSIV